MARSSLEESGETRQRSKREKKIQPSTEESASSTNAGTQAFQQHVQQDEALRQPPQSSDDIKLPALTTLGRVTVFLGFPLVIATVALYVSYLATLYNPDRKLDVDTDFVFPFLTALLLTTVVGFQTGGFTSVKPKPLISWPKVRRQKTVVRKIVIVDDDEDDNTGDVDAANKQD